MTDRPITPFAFYGTLMRGGAYGGVTSLGTYEGSALIRGDLYDTGAFPALMTGTGEVTGRLWRPEPQNRTRATERLDSIEGFDLCRPDRSMYLRRKVQLIEPQLEAWVYFWNYPPPLVKIECGDWAVHSGRVYV